jgi:preprotein translocase subunit SecA
MQVFRVDDLPIESGMLTDALDTAREASSHFFDIRKQLWEYDQFQHQRDRLFLNGARRPPGPGGPG